MLKTLMRAGTALALTLALVPGSAMAQTAPAPAPAAPAATVDADPALWVVKDADTTVYLFGTIHLLKPGLSWFDEGVKAAFDKSDSVVLEMVEPEPAAMQQLVMGMVVNPTGPTTTELLPEGKRAAYAKALTDLGMPAATFDRIDPWFAALTITVANLPKYGFNPEQGAEKVISAAAKAANKPIEGLETAEQQLGYFDGLPQPLQAKFLESTVDQLPQLGTTLDTMVKSWGEGKPDALAALMNESMTETPEIAKLLLADRNARWADWIKARLAKPGTVFVAVGAGHLAGKDSVQDYLAKQGLKAERVNY